MCQRHFFPKNVYLAGKFLSIANIPYLSSCYPVFNLFQQQQRFADDVETFCCLVESNLRASFRVQGCKECFPVFGVSYEVICLDNMFCITLLRYVQTVVKEVFQFHPPASLAIPRQSTQVSIALKSILSAPLFSPYALLNDFSTRFLHGEASHRNLHVSFTRARRVGQDLYACRSICFRGQVYTGITLRFL